MRRSSDSLEEKRTAPRLRLSYPIEITCEDAKHRGATRGVTTDLAARGAYFRTFGWRPFKEGTKVSVRIVVPHALQTGRDTIQLRMETNAEVRRMEEVDVREAYGEDGLALMGIALEFDCPLSFRYFWV